MSPLPPPNSPADGSASVGGRPDLRVTRWLCTLMSLVFVGVGALAVWTEHAPETSTRHGMAGPLEGSAAVHFGVTVMLMGLMPLALWARTPQGAGWWATLTLGGGLLHMAWGLWH